jgi:hypothetical protein
VSGPTSRATAHRASSGCSARSFECDTRSRAADA